MQGAPSSTWEAFALCSFPLTFQEVALGRRVRRGRGEVSPTVLWEWRALMHLREVTPWRAQPSSSRGGGQL